MMKLQYIKRLLIINILIIILSLSITTSYAQEKIHFNYSDSFVKSTITELIVSEENDTLVSVSYYGKLVFLSEKSASIKLLNKLFIVEDIKVEKKDTNYLNRYSAIYDKLFSTKVNFIEPSYKASLNSINLYEHVKNNNFFMKSLNRYRNYYIDKWHVEETVLSIKVDNLAITSQLEDKRVSGTANLTYYLDNGYYKLKSFELIYYTLMDHKRYKHIVNLKNEGNLKIINLLSLMHTTILYVINDYPIKGIYTIDKDEDLVGRGIFSDSLPYNSADLKEVLSILKK